MGRAITLKRGDIFRFDLDDARYGLGQIVEPGMVFFITVLRTPVPRDFDLAAIDTRDILLCGWTTDALLYHGRWRLIGRLPVPEDVIPRPCAKVAVEGEQWIVDSNGELLRRATTFEWEHLDYQSSHSPIAYQRAFHAHHGLAVIQQDYEKLGIDHVRAQAALCSS